MGPVSKLAELLLDMIFMIVRVIASLKTFVKNFLV